MKLDIQKSEQITILATCVSGSLVVSNAGNGSLLVSGYARGRLVPLAEYPACVESTARQPQPDFKAIANELFDTLFNVHQRLHSGLMGDMSGRLAEELIELLARVEPTVKDK